MHSSFTHSQNRYKLSLRTTAKNVEMPLSYSLQPMARLFALPYVVYAFFHVSDRILFLDKRKKCAPDKLSCLQIADFLFYFVCVNFIRCQHADMHVLFINSIGPMTCVMCGFNAYRRSMYSRAFFAHIAPR